jgi:pimeloyl-ACP methyl ester carboxylesterase
MGTEIMASAKYRLRRASLDFADGLSLFARDYAPGSGPAKLPVIAIHGLTRNSADFEGIAPLIAQSGRRVLALDVRGRGRSDRAPDPMTYTPDVYARDVVALMEQAGIERAVFIGTSMGGLITMALTAIKPKAVTAAVLNDIGPEVAPEGLMRIAAYSGQPVDTPTWAAAVDYAAASTKSPSPTMTTPTGRPSPAASSATAPRGRRCWTMTRHRRADPGGGSQGPGPESLAVVPQIGEKPPNPARPWRKLGPSQREIAAKMKKAAPGMDHVEVPGIGHAPMLDEPEAKAAIFEFLGELP